jgi:hypothetical protein
MIFIESTEGRCRPRFRPCAFGDLCPVATDASHSEAAQAQGAGDESTATAMEVSIAGWLKK